MCFTRLQHAAAKLSNYSYMSVIIRNNRGPATYSQESYESVDNPIEAASDRVMRSNRSYNYLA